MQRDSTGQERYIKTTEDETIMKSKITQISVEVATELKNATFNERCAWIRKEKDEGNRIYKEKQFAEATDQYLRCLCGFDFNKKNTTKEQRTEVD